VFEFLKGVASRVPNIIDTGWNVLSEREAQQARKRSEEIGRYVKARGRGKLSIGRLEAEIGVLEKDSESL
jgi:hypothetical protein